MGRNDKGWKVWYDNDLPDECPMPDGYNAATTFSKLLLIRFVYTTILSEHVLHFIMAALNTCMINVCLIIREMAADFQSQFFFTRSWCPDRVLPQARRYISESMGVKFAEGVILNLEEMWKESTKRVPMICFLSMGSDPTNSIDMLSRKHNLSMHSDSINY